MSDCRNDSRYRKDIQRMSAFLGRNPLPVLDSQARRARLICEVDMTESASLSFAVSSFPKIRVCRLVLLVLPGLAYLWSLSMRTLTVQGT